LSDPGTRKRAFHYPGMEMCDRKARGTFDVQIQPCIQHHPRDDAALRVRVGFLMLAVLVIGSPMYFNKDRAQVADRMHPSPMSESGTTGAVPKR
jgi:hypothetical protein